MFHKLHMAAARGNSIPEKSQEINPSLYEIPTTRYIAQSSLLSELELRHAQRIGGFHVFRHYAWVLLLGCFGLLVAALATGVFMLASEDPHVDLYQPRPCFFQGVATPEIPQLVSSEPIGPNGRQACPLSYEFWSGDPADQKPASPVQLSYIVMLALAVETPIVWGAILRLRAVLLERKTCNAIDSSHEIATYQSDSIAWTSLKEGLAKQARDAGLGKIDSIGEEEAWKHFITALTEHTALGKQLDIPLSDYLAKTAELVQKYEASTGSNAKDIERSFAKLGELPAIALFPMIRRDILAKRNQQADVSPAPAIAQQLQAETERQEVLAIISATEQAFS